METFDLGYQAVIPSPWYSTLVLLTVCVLSWCIVMCGLSCSLPSPNPSENFNCSVSCRITNCKACYYADEPQPRPANCETCPYYPEVSQAEDKCFRRWITCTRRSKYNEVKIHTYQLYFYNNIINYCSSVVGRKLKRNSSVMNTLAMACNIVLLW